MKKTIYILTISFLILFSCSQNDKKTKDYYIESQPTFFDRRLIMGAQALFYNFYFFLYLFAPKTAHRVIGYFEEEAVISYTAYLEEIDAGRHDNVPAPDIAIKYWNLPADARLRDVVIAVRAAEAEHRDVNHGFADARGRKARTAAA